VARLSTTVEHEAALRVENLDLETAARLLKRIEELRLLLHEQHEVLLDLLARGSGHDAR